MQAGDYTDYTDAELDALGTALQPGPEREGDRWAWCCTLRASHQRGQGRYHASARDLQLPAGVWPAKLVAYRHRLGDVVLRHDHVEREGQAHIYYGTTPTGTLTLVVWAEERTV